MPTCYGGVSSYHADPLVPERACTPSGRQLVGAYDAAIEALEVGEGATACDLLSWLVDEVRTEQRRVSGGLFRVYRYCLEEISRGELAVPGAVLKEMRGTWAQALLAS